MAVGRSTTVSSRTPLEDRAQAARTLEAYNAAARTPDAAFDPSLKDGLSTRGLSWPETSIHPVLRCKLDTEREA